MTTCLSTTNHLWSQIFCITTTSIYSFTRQTQTLRSEEKIQKTNPTLHFLPKVVWFFFFRFSWFNQFFSAQLLHPNCLPTCLPFLFKKERWLLLMTVPTVCNLLLCSFRSPLAVPWIPQKSLAAAFGRTRITEVIFCGLTRQWKEFCTKLWQRNLDISTKKINMKTCCQRTQIFEACQSLSILRPLFKQLWYF